MKSAITPERANRLAVGLARSRQVPYEQAEEILRTLSLRLVWTLPDAGRAADQAALLTALNTAHRAFLGGVEVQMPADLPLRLPLRGATTLNQALDLSGSRSVELPHPTHTVYFGPPANAAKENDVCVHADGWRGGVSDVGAPADYLTGDADDFALGGVMAGALAVHRCFVRATRLPGQCLDRASGISLWSPSTDWRRPVEGRKLRNLPTRFWMLGLGHLGQAYLWNLALLPHPRPESVDFLLQDFDAVDESNQGSGLLCDAHAIGRKKTRHCAEWLERLGFSTTLNERRFSASDRRTEAEPGVAFCGFDRAAPRLALDTAGFALVLECGLGGTLADFDQADLHVFPSARHTAVKLWGSVSDDRPAISEATARLFGGADQVCGALAIDIAGKSVSTSFVGAMAGALLTAELLRTFNKGVRYDDATFDCRNPRDWNFVPANTLFRASELAQLGVVSHNRDA